MRLIVSLLLSVILTLASQAEAVARSEMAGASDQIVCGAKGPTHITLDASGRGIRRHPCPNCLVAAVVADLPDPAAPAGHAGPAPAAVHIDPALSGLQPDPIGPGTTAVARLKCIPIPL